MQLCRELAVLYKLLLGLGVPLTLWQVAVFGFIELGGCPFDLERFKRMVNYLPWEYFANGNEGEIDWDERDPREVLNVRELAIMVDACRRGLVHLRQFEHVNSAELVKFEGFEKTELKPEAVSELFKKALLRVDSDGIGDEGTPHSQEEYTTGGICLPETLGKAQWALRVDPNLEPDEQLVAWLKEFIPRDAVLKAIGVKPENHLPEFRRNLTKQDKLTSRWLEQLEEPVVRKLVGCVGTGTKPAPERVLLQDVAVMRNQNKAVTEGRLTGEVTAERWLSDGKSVDGIMKELEKDEASVAPCVVDFSTAFPGAFVKVLKSGRVVLTLPNAIDPLTGKIRQGAQLGNQNKLAKAGSGSGQSAYKKRLLNKLDGGGSDDRPGKRAKKEGAADDAKEAPDSPAKGSRNKGLYGMTRQFLVMPQALGRKRVCKYYMNGMRCEPSSCKFSHTGPKVTYWEAKNLATRLNGRGLPIDGWSSVGRRNGGGYPNHQSQGGSQGGNQGWNGNRGNQGRFNSGNYGGGGGGQGRGAPNRR